MNEWKGEYINKWMAWERENKWSKNGIEYKIKTGKWVNERMNNTELKNKRMKEPPPTKKKSDWKREWKDIKNTITNKRNET